MQLTHDMARQSGADHAHIVLYSNQSRHVEVRDGKVSDSEEDNDQSIGVSVLIGEAQAHVSGNDLSPDALQEMVSRAIAMAKTVPGDPFGLPASPDQIQAIDPDKLASLQLHDDSPLLTQQQLIDRAMQADQAGLAHAGITRSDGTSMSHSQSTMHVIASNGLHSHIKRSHMSGSSVMIGGENEEMERDYAYDTSIFIDDFKSPEDIGQLAAERTVARLNPKKGKTGNFPVIFDRRMAATLLRTFARAINGNGIVRGTSFLKDSLGQAVFHPDITIIDNPHKVRGLKSGLNDAEGLACKPETLIDQGTLTQFILDLRSARKLNLSPNGRGRRGLASAASPGSSNLAIQAGKQSLDEMIADIKDGFYITELMGSQVSMTTGDYSRGASGFWIEKGQITHPVSQMTIAGNLNDMFKSMTPASDLETRQAIESPSLLIRTMSCASSD